MSAVIIYTKPGCVQCVATKRAFEKKGISPLMIDVAADAEALAHIVGMGFKQVPVVVAGDKTWSGFDPSKIAAIAA